MKCNEEEMLAAIDDYELYSPTHREVLKVLINVSINDVASITAAYLAKTLKKSLPLVYLIIKQLQEDSFIERLRLKNTRHDSFKINKDRIQETIVELYRKKLNLSK